jgi:hypothetical protein
MDIYDQLVLGLALNPASKTADDKYADIYLLNRGNESFEIEAAADFSTTVNEDIGQTLVHGSRPNTLILSPGAYALVGDIIEWELDSALWFDIFFRKKKGTQWYWLSYHLKGSDAKIVIPQLSIECWVVEPMIKKKKPASTL